MRKQQTRDIKNVSILLLHFSAAYYYNDMYFSSEHRQQDPCEAGGLVQLMGETLIVSSFAKLFCLQFAHLLSLCLCSLPLPLSLYLSFLPCMK